MGGCDVDRACWAGASWENGVQAAAGAILSEGTVAQTGARGVAR